MQIMYFFLQLYLHVSIIKNILKKKKQLSLNLYGKYQLYVMAHHFIAP